jgi:HEAT repeat protein
LRAALGDSDEGVSSGAALELAKLGDSSAIEHCLQALDDPSSQAFDGALRALREPMSRDAALAKRVYERLRSRRDSEAELPIEARTQVLAAIGQVPLEEAARALYEQSRGQTGGVGDMPASRWLVLQAANTGEVGQRLLYASFAGETDARRRIDLLEGIALRANEFAQQALVELLDGEQLTPYETLYAADRLTRMAPVEVAAPLLKRVTLRIAHPDVRPALQCLLWSNYPGPN